MTDPKDAGAQSFTAMSLRDYFASQALNGLVASGAEYPVEQFADTAYRMADAMLVERAKDAEAHT